MRKKKEELQKLIAKYQQQVNEAIDEAIEMSDIPTPFRAWLKVKIFRKRGEKEIKTELPTPQYVECPKCHYKFKIN